MNPERPHEIQSFDLGEALRESGYVPLAPDTAARLRELDEDERAKYLATLRSKINGAAKAAAIGQTVLDRLQRSVDPVIDAMDESAPDSENLPRLIGLVVGVRAWMGSFAAIEDRVVEALLSHGITRDHYDAVRTMADAEGLRVVERVRALVDSEE